MILCLSCAIIKPVKCEVINLVTDEQYKELQKRVNDLENKYNQLSTQFMTLYMKQDAHSNSIGRSVTSSRTSKDKTKYLMNGKVLCKRKLVLECIKEYVNANPTLSYDEVHNLFPDYIQGPLGVIKPPNQAEKYSNAKKRYFFNDDDVIRISNKEYVVCCQWSINNIKRFIQVAKEIGFIIEPLNVE